MAIEIQVRRGTEHERITIVPLLGELIYCTDSNLLYIGDGTTLGGKLVSTSEVVTEGGVPGLMTGADKTKLDGIQTGAEVNVQPDWNQTLTTADDFIKNKPPLGGGTFTSLTDVPSSYTGKKGYIVTVNSNETGLDFEASDTADAELNSTGIVSGGLVVYNGGISFTVRSGVGHIVNHNTEVATRISWAEQTIASIGDGVNYFCIDTTNTLRVLLNTIPDTNYYLYVGSTVATQGNTVIIDVETNPVYVGDFPNRVTSFVDSSMRTIVTSGCLVSEQAAPHYLKINVSDGVITSRLKVIPITPNNTLIKVFATSDYGFVPDTGNLYSPADTVNVMHWNDITKGYGTSLVEMTDGYWKKDLIAIFPSSAIFYVYGQEEFLTEASAQAAPLQSIPETVSTAAVYLAFIISRKGDTSIANRFVDIRPYFDRIWGLGGDVSAVNLPYSSINMMSTGLLNGGILSINNSNHSTFNMTGGNAIIINNTDILNPTYIPVHWNTLIGVSTPYLLTHDTTYIQIDSSGQIVFATSILTADERRQYIEIGWISHPNRITISFAKTQPFYNADIQAQLNDFIESYSPFNIEGNEYTFSTSTGLTIKRSKGSVFDGNANYSNDNNNPHIITTNSRNPVNVIYFYRNTIGGWVNSGSPVATIDPNHYDNAGVLTTVPDNNWTIQVISYYPVTETNNIQYGQVVYNTYKEALSNLYAIIDINPYLSSGVFRTWLIVKQGAINLSNNLQANFFNAGRIRLNDIIGGTENDETMIETCSTGQVEGGFITPIGGINFIVSAGSGYITDNSTFLKRVTWEETQLSTVVDGRNFVMVDVNGRVFCEGIVDDYYNNIQAGVLFSGGGNTQLVEIINSPRSIRDFPGRVMRYQQIALQAIVGVGCEVSEREAPNFLQLQINPGLIYVNMNEHVVNVTNTFIRMYNTSNYGWVPYTNLPLNTIVPSIYNDVTKPYGQALVPLTDSYWKKDLVFRCPDGNVFVICGQAQYPSKDEARRAPLPTLPGQLGAVAAFLCAIICQKEDITIADRIQDIRPNFARIFQEDATLNGVPAGGRVNQVLAKIDSTDFNTTWIDISAHGLTQEIQFNTNGAFDSDPNLKFDKSNKALLINGATSLNNNPLAIQGIVDNNVQVNVRNLSDGLSACSSFVAVADDGSDDNNVTFVGINNSNYSDPLETIWGPHDGYLYTRGEDLTVGTYTAGKEIKLHTGGVMASNVRATIDDNGINLPAGNTFRINEFDLTKQITNVSSAIEEAAAFAAGSKIVIRLDLL